MLKTKISEIQSSIFRAYDIRGVVDETLTEHTVYLLGQAIGSLAREKGERRITVGRDGRLSGKVLNSALCKGLLSTGCDVLNLGVVPTPLLYYSTYVLETRSGVMLTGSHNPPNYNGLKIMIDGETLAEKEIQKLYQRIVNTEFLAGQGEKRELDIIDRYIFHIARDIKLKRPLKIVVDCGNGVAGKIAPSLFRHLGCDVIELFCDIDGRFPNHHPDPSQVENLEDLIKTVVKTGADIGLAFDGDGDRLGIVTNKGDIIWPDRQLILFAKHILAEKPGSKIIYDVKCTRHLEKIILEAGGEPIMWKTGHSLIKSKLAETQAVLAGEMSGHFFFKDKWYGFDDALYAGARLLQILANQLEECHTVFSAIPNSVNTPELKVYVDEAEKFQLMKDLIENANFSSAKINTIDGMRVNFEKGWGLVRPSNTTPCLVLRFEANDHAFLEYIKNLFKENLLALKPDLILPF